MEDKTETQEIKALTQFHPPALKSTLEELQLKPDLSLKPVLFYYVLPRKCLATESFGKSEFNRESQNMWVGKGSD
jgi:hypothetical protein